MTRILLTTLFTSFCFLFASGQERYPPGQHQAFTKIYLASKQFPRSEIEPPLSKYNVSNERYAYIFQQKLIGERVELSANEIQLIEAISAGNLKAAEKRKKSLELLCSIHDLKYETYLEILYLYNSSIIFQRSLKPYFDLEIKKLNGE